MFGAKTEFELLVRLDAGAVAPSRAHPEDAGYDLFAPAEVRLAPGQRRKVNTGVRVAAPAHIALLVVPKSGLAANHGITVVNAPGLIDPGYRNEIGVVLLNTSEEPFVRPAGKSIAQLLLVPFYAPRITLRDELPGYGERDQRGFGTTG